MPSWQQKVPKILTYTLPKDCLNILTKVRARLSVVLQLLKQLQENKKYGFLTKTMLWSL